MDVNSSNDTQKTLAFWDIFLQRDPAGDYVFSDVDIRGFLPLLFIQLYQVLGERTPQPIQQQLRHFVEALGLPADTDSKGLEQVVKAHFEANPPNPHLVKAYERFLREHSKGELSAELGRSFEKFAGERAVAFEKSPVTGNKKAGGALSALLGIKNFESNKK
jgi:hypothetical protein